MTPEDSAAAGAGRPPDDVPLREKIALGCGFVTSQGSDVVIHVLANPVYNVTLGMSPALIGVLFFLQRIWNLAVDPVAGSLSDNVRSRFCRRRPLLALAVVPLAVCFAGLFLVPPQLGGRSLFLYLLGASLLFYTARSFYAIPLLALQAEATGDYHGRTRLAGFTQIFFFVFAIAPNWLFAWIQGPMFANPLAGVRCAGLVFGAVFLLAGLVPVFFAREPLYTVLASRPPRASPREYLRTILANRPFLRVLGAQCCTTLGYNLVGVLGLYLTFYRVYAGDIPKAAVMQSWAGTAYQLAAIASIPLYRRLSVACGKKATLQVSAAVIMAGCGARMVLFQPAHPWLIVLIWAASGAGTTGVSVLCLSMLADVIDDEELRTGARREGLYASALSLCDRLGFSLGALASGFILVRIGFDVRLGGHQPAQTLQLMTLLYAVAPFAGALGAALIIHRYPFSEVRGAATTAQLQERRRILARNRLGKAS